MVMCVRQEFIGTKDNTLIVRSLEIFTKWKNTTVQNNHKKKICKWGTLPVRTYLPYGQQCT